MIADIYKRLAKALALVTVMSAGTVFAEVYPLPPRDVDIIGELRTVEVQEGETLLDIGRRYGLGYEEMKLANPGVDVWLPEVGRKVVVPTRFILPPGPREGLVLNLPEMRLYYYPPVRPGEQPTVETYAVSIGRMDWRTPLGEARVVTKVKDPAWYPPESIKQEARAEGREMPAVVPAGPDNPLGRYAMRLSIPGYLIHSTNRPWGVGMRATHGCVRMYPEDIEGLFPRVPVDTPIRIINEPYKVGWFAGKLYLEVHPVLEEHQSEFDKPLKAVVEKVAAKLGDSDERVDHSRLRMTLEIVDGIPMPISRDTTPPLQLTANFRDLAE